MICSGNMGNSVDLPILFIKIVGDYMDKRIEELLQHLLEEGQHRGDLSELRKMIRENPVEASRIVANHIMDIVPFLADSDAKTRKNAASLLSDILYNTDSSGRHMVAQPLFDAYMKEETLFVRGAYLSALSYCDCEPYMTQFTNRLTFINETDWDETEKKHIREERRELESILAGGSLAGKHSFEHFKKPYEMLLLSDAPVRESIAAELGGDARVVGGGVRTRLEDDRVLSKIRTYKEAWFLIPVKKGLVLDEKNLAELATGSRLLPMLDELLGGDGTDSYSFRLEIHSPKKENQLGAFLRKKGFELEEASKGRLRNLPSNYEITLILVARKSGGFAPYLRLDESLDHRFDYRSKVEATSMMPVRAAEVVELIRPYLGEGVQIIDPFCGVGTLLIERHKAVPAREIYGTDIYEHAIIGARENTKNAGMIVHYINRDYFDFTHEYLFDEVITEFPDLYGKSPKERDGFYRSFFDKSMEITCPNAMLFLVSSEENQVKKQIRLHKGLKLVRTFELRKHQNIYIIEKKAVTE